MKLIRLKRKRVNLKMKKTKDIEDNEELLLEGGRVTEPSLYSFILSTLISHVTIFTFSGAPYKFYNFYKQYNIKI